MLTQMFQALQFVREEIYEEFTLRQLCLLLYVAQHEGETQMELAASLNISEGVISKNIKMMCISGKRDSEGKMVLKGHGLLDIRPDIWDRKRNACFLSAKGKTVIAGIEKILQ